jgi:hypothetical protein
MTDPANFDQDRRTPTASGRWTVAAIAARLARDAARPGSSPLPPTVTGLEPPPVADPDPTVIAVPDGSAYPVAPKVRAAGIWSALGGLAVAVAVLVSENPALLGDWLPDWALAVVVPLAAAIAGTWGGYQAPHQPRPGDAGVAAPQPPGAGLGTPDYPADRVRPATGRSEADTGPLGSVPPGTGGA